MRSLVKPRIPSWVLGNKRTHPFKYRFYQIYVTILFTNNNSWPENDYILPSKYSLFQKNIKIFEGEKIEKPIFEGGFLKNRSKIIAQTLLNGEIISGVPCHLTPLIYP